MYCQGKVTAIAILEGFRTDYFTRNHYCCCFVSTNFSHYVRIEVYVNKLGGDVDLCIICASY